MEPTHGFRGFGGKAGMAFAVKKAGKDESFFDLLASQARIAVKAAETFSKMISDLPGVHGYTQTLSEIENEGDTLTHRLQNKLSATFITPLDKEDLSGLSHLLDDVTDCIESVGARIAMYKIQSCRPEMFAFANNILKVSKVTEEAVTELGNQFHRSRTLPGLLVQIHTLENDNDVRYRTALSNLFDDVSDPIAIIKWKEVYDRVENAIDKCESVANVIENMIVKYA